MTLIAEARQFLQKLDAAGVPHMLVGAMALDVVGTPRATMDIDIQIHADHGPATGASSFLGAIIEERTHDPTFDQDVLILHLPTYAVPIEVFLSQHWFTKQALARRRFVESAELDRVPVPTPEDFVLLKAAFHQSPHRTTHKRASDGVDLEDVVRNHRQELDRAYLQNNATRLGIWPFVESLLDEADQGAG